MKLIKIESGIVCRHHSGRVYTILHVTNLDAKDTVKFPPDVVYMGANGKVWSRPYAAFCAKFQILFDGSNIALEID